MRPSLRKGILIKDQRSAPTSCDSRLERNIRKKNKMMRLWKYRAFFATALFIRLSTFYFYFSKKSKNDSFE